MKLFHLNFSIYIAKQRTLLSSHVCTFVGREKLCAVCCTMRIMLQNLLVFVSTTYFVATLVQATIQDGYDGRKPYIVYMGELPGLETNTMDDHHNLLTAAIGDDKLARESKMHSYGRSFNGFVARLLPHEAERLSDEDTVVSVFPNTLRELHTTRSWDFVGLPKKSKKRNPRIESNIIVGVFDTGIWTDCPSFSDKGFGPPPAKWRGKCVKGVNFTGCNNKVIGAKFFNLDNGPDLDESNRTPVDDDGHGTHTSSTIAGVEVPGASVSGIAKGTARGGAPLSRIAMYKVCWMDSGCSDMNLLAAFDEAISDGVDLISISMGGPSESFFDDPIAIGSFHAMKKGIFVACSAGNSGPSAFTVTNAAPWIMTVAANSIDRKLKTVVKLGNGKSFSGSSLNTFSPKRQMYPLTSGALASGDDMLGNKSACDAWTLFLNKVKGKIIYCVGSNRNDGIINELQGVGTIMSKYEEDYYTFTALIPATIVLVKDAIKIDHYINSTKNPMAVIQKTKAVNMTAPFIAPFSSRGPQLISPNILKPDISAPGINILAAYSKLSSLSGDEEDKRHSVFNIISGTSMSCPHAVAAAAYVKSFHPDWSPAAIKSALMTTATPMKIKDADAELGSGAGQINPTKAVNPGLVYDISVEDYIRFLCKEGYNSTSIAMLVGGKNNYSCSGFEPALGTDGLNYPTMHTQLQNPLSFISAVFYRTVTHVGFGQSVYKAKVNSPKGISVRVTPSTLKFTQSHQKQSFKVAVSGAPMENGTQILSALLEWDDSKHSVKSYIVVYRPLT